MILLAAVSFLAGVIATAYIMRRTYVPYIDGYKTIAEQWENRAREWKDVADKYKSLATDLISASDKYPPLANPEE